MFFSAINTDQICITQPFVSNSDMHNVAIIFHAKYSKPYSLTKECVFYTISRFLLQIVKGHTKKPLWFVATEVYLPEIYIGASKRSLTSFASPGSLRAYLQF